jgi:hypothetical protein
MTSKSSLWISTFALSVFLTACSSKSNTPSADAAIDRVENCVCYRSIESQNLKPWQLAWDNPEKLRKQFSHCICQAQIDVKNVPDPKRYIIPGSVVK